MNVVIDSIILKSRETVHNKTVLFKDNKYIIEGTDIDFWYMGENTMTITSKYTKEEFYDMDRIQVYVKLPWSSGYSQVFSLYHDGLVSLLPMTPHGLDWIPSERALSLVKTTPVMLDRPHQSKALKWIRST